MVAVGLANIAAALLSAMHIPRLPALLLSGTLLGILVVLAVRWLGVTEKNR